MTPRRAVIGTVFLFILALLGVTLVVVSRGAGEPALVGLLLGAALGGLSLFFESVSLSWALRNRPSFTLGISLGGFGIRLVLVSVLTLVFARTKSVDAVTFALTYVASFLAFVVLQVWAVARLAGKSESVRESE